MGGSPARGDDLLPERLLPARLPRERARRVATRCLQNMVQQGYITQEEYDRYSPDQGETAIPTAKEIQPPAENSPRLISRRGCDSNWSTATAPARPSAAACRSSRRWTSSSSEAPRASSARRSAALARRPPSVVLDNKTANVLAMVGGPNYQEAPFNLATNGHRQPGSSFKPFTLVTALEQGHSPDEVFTSAPQEIPFRAKVRRRTARAKVVNELFKVNNYDDSYLGSASIASATTYSDNSVYSQLGTQVGPQNVAATARRWASRPTSRPRPVLDRRRPVRALQPGADPRRPRDRGHARSRWRTRTTRSPRAASGLGHDGRRQRRPGRDHRRHDGGGLEATMLPARRPGPDETGATASTRRPPSR